jgi:cell division protein FtsZ
MKFDLPKDQSSIIKVIGVGGGGSNAVNHMYKQGIKGVDFIVCNTDQQALDISPVPVKIQLGASLTEGRGAGSIPDVGKNAAIENVDEIKEILSKQTKMVFVTAGMGGGTGTGAAPVIAKIAREMGILTVGIVTIPFGFEGKKRRQQAEEGLNQMRANVDTLLVICNDRLREMHGNLTLVNAFEQADDVLAVAAKGIAEVISVTGAINVDFNDVNTVMKDSGVAVMGSAMAEGEDRALKAVEQALASPLLNDNNIKGAKYVLLNITYGDKEVLMDEISDVTDYIQDEAGSTADVIWGHGWDETLGDNLSITIIATGFNSAPDTGFEDQKEEQKTYRQLDEDVPTMITTPIESPTQSTPVETKYHHLDESEGLTEEPYMKTSETEETTEETTTPTTPVESVEEEVDGEQVSFEFEVKSPFENKVEEEVTNEPEMTDASDDGMKRYYLEDEPTDEVENVASEEEEKYHTGLTAEEQQKKANERITRIKELSMKLKTPSGIADLENEPAYKRRQVNLETTPHSSENTVSKYTLSEEEGENGDKKTEIKPNNSFLHDNVD